MSNPWWSSASNYCGLHIIDQHYEMAKGNSIVSISKKEQLDQQLQSQKSFYWFMINAEAQSGSLQTISP